MLDILFLLKQRRMPGCESVDAHQHPEYCLSSGLRNSVNFLLTMLERLHLKVGVREVIDGNDIDRYLHRDKPKIAIIEALWVTPAKLEQLARLHPSIKFVVRLHSNVPFLAHEGVAYGWLAHYLNTPNVYLAANHVYMFRDLQTCFPHRLEHILFMPNYYEPAYPSPPVWVSRSLKGRQTINIGCFGAIRPFKNHVQQAVAAIKFANQHHVHMHFHVNGGRIENKGDNVFKNLTALFDGQVLHKLVIHDWMEHADFLRVVHHMDIGLQVSFSETFNIVTADFVSAGVPMVVSPQIDWMPEYTHANPNDTRSIVDAMNRVYNSHLITWRSYRALLTANRASESDWTKTLGICS